jgi:phosphoribosyl 1,2-cyclic phosphodiesterase
MSLKVCSLASGSSGNATYVTGGRTAILVDSGCSAREVTARLAAIGTHPGRLSGILITHAHSDHYRSAGTLHARYGIPVYIDPSTARSAARRGGGTSWRRIHETRPIPERIGDIEVEALDTIHGYPPEEGRTVAYRLSHGQISVGVVTDLGCVPPALLRRLRGLDILLIEANYEEQIVRDKLRDPRFVLDWRYLNWVLSDRGHLSNLQCAETLASIIDGEGMHVFLGHVSDNHSDPRRDNNQHGTALSAIRSFLQRQGTPVPHLHKTHRIGLAPGGPSVMVEIE